jgi:glycosyltransferase involved in cell wall biosynthesis
MEISVIMSVYNSENTLTGAIESILQQNFKDFEFIIINDGSTDGTTSILSDYKQKDSRIILINQPRMGLVYSLNQGLKIAQGEYILRQDADDLSLAYRMEKQLEYIKQHNLDIVSSYAFLVNKRGRFLKIIKCPSRHEDIARKLEKHNCILHPTLMFKKTSILSLGRYNQDCELIEDYDLYLRAILQGLKFGTIPEPLVKIRFHPSGVSVKYRRKQLLNAISVQARYFSRQDKFKLRYIIYIMHHIIKLLIPSSIRQIRIWLREIQ